MITDQGDRQLNAIDTINTDKIKSIEFHNKKNKEAKKLANKINKAIEKIKEIKNRNDNEPRFTYYRSDKTSDISDRYIDINELGKEIQNSLISL